MKSWALVPRRGGVTPHKQHNHHHHGYHDRGPMVTGQEDISGSSILVQRRPRGGLLFKPKKVVVTSIFIVIVAFSTIKTNTQMEQRARMLYEEREKMRELITIEKAGGACDIGSPVQGTRCYQCTSCRQYQNSPCFLPWIRKTFHMDCYQVADDWNFSGKLHANLLTIKTSWPHKEGTLELGYANGSNVTFDS